jgi:hypothetical protein
MNYKRLAVVLALPAYYFLLVLIAQLTGFVAGTTANPWGNGAFLLCCTILAIGAVGFVCGIVSWVYRALEALWKWLHQKEPKLETGYGVRQDND